MSVTVGKYSGFCFGVARAVRLLDKCLESGEKTYCIGEMIHNPVFNADAASRGLITVSENEIDSIEEGSNVIIRSHGIRLELENELKKKNCKLIDATCFDVKKIHKIISENTAADSLLIMIGDPKHPEVIASLSYAKGKAVVFEDYSKISEKSNINLIFGFKNVIMVAQTTHSVSDYEKCKKFLKKVYTNAKIFDTICGVTEARQKEAYELSLMCDAMFVVGGKSSSNTLKLYGICKSNCDKTYFVESAEDVVALDKELKIGIVAGASTPSGLIEEVTNICQNN